MIKKAKKKSVEIEYIEFETLKRMWLDDHRENAHMGFKYNALKRLEETGNGHNLSYVRKDDLFKIKTLEGTYDMTKKDVLIIGIKGEIYPCKIDIFELTHDILEEL